MKSLLCLALCTFAASAFAETSSLNNTATVVSHCTIAVTKNLDFGVINPLNYADQQEIKAAGSVQLMCTKQSVVLNMDFGSTTKGDGARRPNASVPNVYACDRRMRSSVNPAVKYFYRLSTGPTVTQADINRDEAISNPNYNQSNICDNTQSKFATLEFTSPKMDVPIYGTLAVSKYLAAGVYSDVVTVSVVF